MSFNIKAFVEAFRKCSHEERLASILEDGSCLTALFDRIVELERESGKERAKIVAWLRNAPPEHADDWGIAADLADAIERGEYEK